MYIISKFKDYYDGVAGTTGIDKTVVYQRTEDAIEKMPKFLEDRWDSNEPVAKLKHYLQFAFDKDLPWQKLSFFVISFCGKPYIGFKIIPDGQPSNFEITYNIDDVIKKIYKKPGRLITKSINIHKFKETYQEVQKVFQDKFMDFHFEYKSPVLIYDYMLFGDFSIKHKDTILVNPELKSYDFYKMVDSFTTFQEIQMFISGVLGAPEKPAPEVSDKNKIQAKGFDYKWSFRKKSKS